MRYIFNAVISRVIDGDTVEAVIDLGFNIRATHRLRLIGINAPEKKEAGYSESTAFLKLLIDGKSVMIETTKADSFGRYLADITTTDENGKLYNVNLTMVDRGHAVTYGK